MTYDGTDPDDDGVVESDVDNQSTTTETLDTGEATITNSPTIDGVTSDIHWEQVAELDPSNGAPLTANVEPFEVVRIVYSLRLGGAGDIFLRVNGDGPSTGDYGYYNQSGSKTTGGNEFLILSGTGGFAAATGVLEIRSDGNGRIGFSNTPQTSLIIDVDGYGVSGGRENSSDPVTDISIDTDASLSPDGEVRVFGGVNQ